MNVSWINPADLVEHELNLLQEEGFDVVGLRAQWESCRAGSASPKETAHAAEAFLNELTPLSVRSADDPVEPSELSKIVALSRSPLPVAAVPAALADRIAGGWYGRAAGCLLGKPVEKIRREEIRELLMSNGTWPLTDYISEKGIPQELLQKYPWNRHSGRESLRENIVCMPEDDDMNYPMLNLAVLESAGIGFTTENIAKAWLEMLPVLATFTAERVAYLNCLKGMDAPSTAIHRNPYREWIGAQIRGDIWGWIAPGDPARAAALAYQDARLSHVRNGIYGEMFVAGAIAAALVEGSPHRAIEAGLAIIPGGSRLAEAVRFALALPESAPTWEQAVDRLYERYGRYHWVHAVNNAALVAGALVYGEGDFGRSICNVVMGGWDTDSNGATVGSIMGTLIGAQRLPEQWILPLHNRIRSSLKGFDNSTIDGLAGRTTALALQA